MNQNITADASKGWWRWPLVPIASIAAAVIGAIVLATLQEFAVSFHHGYAKDGWFHIYVYPLIPSAVAGYLLAGTAFRVAPAAKIKSGVVMTVIMGVVLVGFTAFCWSADVPAGEAVQVTVGSLATMAGAVVALLAGGEE